MKKLFLPMVTALLVSSTVVSQSYPSNATFREAMKPALVLNVPYKTGIAEKTILQKLEETGYNPETKGALFWKKNKIDGYYQFEGVQLPELQNQKLDLYFKVDQRSKREKEQSIIYLLVSKGYDNFVSKDTDEDLYMAARRFLNSFVAETAEYKLNLDIETAEKEVGAASSKLEDLKKEQSNLERKLESIKNEIRSQQNLLEERRLKAEELKSKTAGNIN